MSLNPENREMLNTCTVELYNPEDKNNKWEKIKDDIFRIQELNLSSTEREQQEAGEENEYFTEEVLEKEY